MEKFYRQLATEKSIIQSLAETQREMIKDPKFNHPFYWAAFVLIGNGL